MATDAKPVAAEEKPKTTKALTPVDEVRNSLLSEHMKSQLVMALPPQMPPERFQRVAVSAINKNPDLLKCDRAALYGAFMLAAQDGLLPDGREAAIVVYGDKPQYMPMVGGLLKKVRNSGEIATLTARIIHRNDEFDYWTDDDGEHLKYKPELFSERGEIIGAFALAKTKDAELYVEVMSKEEIEKVRAISKVKSGGPWTQWWEEMAKKTVIRRLSKRLPMSTDLDDLIRRDDELYDVEAKVTDTAQKPKPNTPGRLQKMLDDPMATVEGTATESPEKPKETAEKK